MGVVRVPDNYVKMDQIIWLDKERTGEILCTIIMIIQVIIVLM